MQPDPAPPIPSDTDGQSPRLRSHGRGLLAFRGLILAVTLAIGITFLVRGDVFIGVLITALAVMRIGLVVSLQRRRHVWRAEIAERRAAGGPRGPFGRPNAVGTDAISPPFRPRFIGCGRVFPRVRP